MSNVNRNFLLFFAKNFTDWKMFRYKIILLWGLLSKDLILILLCGLLSVSKDPKLNSCDLIKFNSEYESHYLKNWAFSAFFLESFYFLVKNIIFFVVEKSTISSWSFSYLKSKKCRILLSATSIYKFLQKW